jgi:hypothetical protein
LTTAPLTVLAQDEEVHGLAYRIIEGVLPVAIIFLILFVFLRFTMKKNRSYQQRAIDHMDRIEQKYDKIIELLGKLTDQK